MKFIKKKVNRWVSDLQWLVHCWYLLYKQAPFICIVVNRLFPGS